MTHRLPIFVLTWPHYLRIGCTLSGFTTIFSGWSSFDFGRRIYENFARRSHALPASKAVSYFLTAEINSLKYRFQIFSPSGMALKTAMKKCSAGTSRARAIITNSSPPNRRWADSIRNTNDCLHLNWTDAELSWMDQSRFNVTPGAHLPPKVMMALAVVAGLALILRGILDVFQYSAV